MAMDGRSITSTYDFSESDSESIHSGQGQMARSVSLARRYVSTVSLYSMRKRDSGLAQGKGIRSIASEQLLREKSHGYVPAELRPKTSYMFSLGKEHDGLVEIIPESPPCDENDTKHDSLVEITPATPICKSDAQKAMPDEGVSYEQWRHSALLPVPANHIPDKRPGTCASSIYSQDGRGSEYFDYASSIHSRESGDTVRTRTLVPGQLHLRTRSLLSLAKKYSSPDDASIYSRYECGVLAPVPGVEDAALQDDDCSVYSRDEMAVPIPKRPSTRKGTMASTHSLPTPVRNSWDSKPLPPLPLEQEQRDQQTWLSPPSPNGESKEAASKIWWRRDSTVLPNPVKLIKRSTTRGSESSVSSCSQASTIRHRPSSWSWLSVNTTLSDRASSIGSRTVSEPSMSRGQKYLRTLSMREPLRSEPAPETQAARYSASPPPRYSGIYREAAGTEHDEMPSTPPRMLPRDVRRVVRQDPLQLPPLQLPELPDDQSILFYGRCGHLETSQELVEDGPELPGWCPQCLKGRQRKRRVVKKELKSMLKSIAE